MIAPACGNLWAGVRSMLSGDLPFLIIAGVQKAGINLGYPLQLPDGVQYVWG